MTIDIIAHGREIKLGTVYGSEPPPLDTVWRRSKEQGLQVNVHTLSMVSGKEKKVDTQMAVDITKLVLTNGNATVMEIWTSYQQ